MAKRARKQEARFTEEEIDTSMVRAAPPPVPLQRAPLLAPPIQTQYATRDAVFALLNEKVREQRNAISDLADFVFNAVQTPAPEEPGARPVILRRVLAGTSGCGKTESVLWIKYLLGMEAGYEYETQYLYIDGAAYNDELQAGSLMGASAGLVGYRDGNSLADRLNNAVANYRNEEARALAAMDPDSLLTKKAQAAYARKMAARSAEERAAAVPAYLLLFIDELDKAHPRLLECLTGLLSSGVLPTPAGVTFTLPPQTRLLVITACNYGARGITAMKLRSRAVGQRCVEDAMSEAGLQPCTVERLGLILIYYPLCGDTLRAVLLDKLEQYIARSALTQRVGPERVVYSPDVKDFMIERVMALVDVERGLRNGMRKLFESLDALFKTGLRVLNALLCSTTAPLPEGAQLSVDRHVFEQTVESEWTPIMRHIHEDVKNEEELALCAHSGRPVEAIVMRMGDQPIANLVTNLHMDIAALCSYETPDVTQNVEHAQAAYESLRARYTNLKRDVGEAAQAIRQASDNPVRVRAILDELELSDDEEGDAWRPGGSSRHKRLCNTNDDDTNAPKALLFEPLVDATDEDVQSITAPVTQQVEEIQVDEVIVPPSSSPADPRSKKGRPKAVYDGFVWLFYQDGRSYYRCTNCNTQVNKRGVRSHLCNV